MPHEAPEARPFKTPAYSALLKRRPFKALQRKKGAPARCALFDTEARLAAEILGVALGVLFPLLGQIVERENRRNRTHGHAGAAINALDRIDVKHLFGRSEERRVG